MSIVEIQVDFVLRVRVRVRPVGADYERALFQAFKLELNRKCELWSIIFQSQNLRIKFLGGTSLPKD